MNKTPHITSYKTYMIILVTLIVLTLVSVLITQVEFNNYTIAVALLLASVKSSIVLTYFMHLKYDNILYKIMLSGVLFLVVVVLLITFLDYSYR